MRVGVTKATKGPNLCGRAIEKDTVVNLSQCRIHLNQIIVLK